MSDVRNAVTRLLALVPMLATDEALQHSDASFALEEGGVDLAVKSVDIAGVNAPSSSTASPSQHS